jgi:hypothetical protein
MGRHVLVPVLVVAFLSILAIPAGAVTPAGPRLAISVFTNAPGEEDGGSEVMTTGPSGEDPRRLLGGPGASIGDSLAWSGDGNSLAFGVSGVESTASGRFGTGWQVVAVAQLDSGTTRAFPRAFLNAGEPVLAADGGSVAFQRVKLVKILPGRESYLFKSAIWTLDVGDGSVRRLTPWRLAAFLEPISYSPDGSAIVAEYFDYRRDPRVVAVDLRGRRTRRLALLGRNASEPTYSPDGTKLAFVRLKRAQTMLPEPERPVSELVVASANGTGTERVVRRRGYMSFPSWDPSGSRLAFTLDPPAEATGSLEREPGNEVMAVNADGTCLTRVFTDPEVTVYGSAWQPGPGREAGRIEC